MKVDVFLEQWYCYKYQSDPYQNSIIKMIVLMYNVCTAYILASISCPLYQAVKGIGLIVPIKTDDMVLLSSTQNHLEEWFLILSISYPERTTHD